MKDRKSFELDLEMLLEGWQMSLHDFDHVSNIGLHILKEKLMKLHDSYNHEADHELDFLLEVDSLGG